ncbi:PPOX class F420-dependent oxidoreductase [Salinactinospora qingdaonensis]|uniref:PPOX class F420-dependent oxidoreductase n=1 Tax=Salinactinospora qingdaonensis TaxID=702744 RepID=A0ABP7EXA4_9ACTN
MSVIPQDREDILNKLIFAHVSTIGPNGEPQSNPVWVDWDGEFVKFSQTPARQKYRNIQRDSRIALSAHDPDNPYRYLEIRGRVEKIEDDTDNAFINKMAKKYIDEEVYPWASPDERRVVLFVRPEHVTKQ